MLRPGRESQLESVFCDSSLSCRFLRPSAQLLFFHHILADFILYWYFGGPAFQFALLLAYLICDMTVTRPSFLRSSRYDYSVLSLHHRFKFYQLPLIITSLQPMGCSMLTSHGNSMIVSGACFCITDSCCLAALAVLPVVSFCSDPLEKKTTMRHAPLASTLLPHSCFCCVTYDFPFQ